MGLKAAKQIEADFSVRQRTVIIYLTNRYMFAHEGSVIRWVLILVIALSTIACSSTSPEERLSNAIRRLAGPEAEDCGRVRISETRTAVNACSVRAFRNQRPFFARYDARGMDSSIAHVLVRTPAGDMFDVAYDSDPSGGSRVSPRIEPRRLSDCAVVNASDGEQVKCK